MTSSLVGSEMCIRDSLRRTLEAAHGQLSVRALGKELRLDEVKDHKGTVSYTHLTLPTICSV
eukprot:7218190-Prorocentrum_lima.AAC.1